MLSNDLHQYKSKYFYGDKMNKNLEKQIGFNISKIRVNNGFTQEYVATKMQLEGCDITRSAIAKIEVGQRHLYPDEIVALKKILECSYDDLFSTNAIEKK